MIGAGRGTLRSGETTAPPLFQATLASALPKWEGAPDNDFFRAQVWVYLNQLPEGAQITAADGKPRFRVDVTVPGGDVDAWCRIATGELQLAA
ncbi:hypothetical protein [Kutzneria buriramensis]|uniref:hypothetical protein n=1 Tax=Kutzneria buriramensis TaxID=1045776 RepID=UPI001B86FB0F|nr:hypothetical protein [Kutzneria buriramensis]